MSSWYPSHMARARREVRQNLRVVDIVIEVLDSRIPASSRIPGLQQMIGQKHLLLALNKADLADQHVTARWVDHYARMGITAVPVNAASGDGMRRLVEVVRSEASTRATGGMRLRPFRAMAVGIPNVGKSSLLNRFAGRKSLRTGQRPGVTRGKQWIRVTDDLELLDLPGIMWPEQRGDLGFVLLCITGAIPDEVMDKIEVAVSLIEILHGTKPDALAARYGASAEATSPYSLLESIARARGFLGSGGVPDISKAAQAVLSDFRTGRLGRLSLEFPPDTTSDTD